MRLILLSLLVASSSLAAVLPPRLVNFDLKSQITNDPLRTLPRSELFRFALDGKLFYQASDNQGYYHGGYWLDLSTELTPIEHFSVNSRLVFENPAASYGVVATSALVPFIGINWVDNFKNTFGFDLDFRFRFFDLDRQTLGSGLTLQEKEMSGFQSEFIKGPIRLRYIFDGTGGYETLGDLHYFQLDGWDNAIGLYTFNTVVTGTLPRFYGAYSTLKPWTGITTRVDLATRNAAWAALLAVEHARDWLGWLATRIKVQARNYARGFATGLNGRIEHDYLSVDQEDKEFHDSSNIFVLGDGIWTLGVSGDVRIQIASWVHLLSMNEWMRMTTATTSGDYYFYTHGLLFCPMKSMGQCLQLHYSNKMSSAAGAPTFSDTSNKFFFYDRPHIGLLARFRF